MADLWWGLNSMNVVGYCGYTPDVACCDNPYPTLENAMDGDSCWVHSVDHVHWATFDLGDLATIKRLRGASNAGAEVCGGNPWFVNVYISNYDNYGDWHLVASDINTWRLGCSWQEVNSDDHVGRYVLVEITECQWYYAYVDRLRWGTPNCSGYPPPNHHALIFDVFGDWWTPPPPPSKAVNPSPVHGATNQSTDVNLSWSDGGGADSFNVYFGTDSTPDSGEFKGNQPGTFYDPGPLLYGTTYFWRIDSVNEWGVTTGDVWWFKTELASLSGTIAIHSTADARVSVKRRLRGSITIECAVTGHVVGVGVPLSGTNECMLVAYSRLSDQFISLKGTVAIHCRVGAGALGTPVYASGSLSGYATATGTLEFVSFTELVAGTTISGTSASGTLTDSAVLLSGAIASKSTVSGKISGATVYCTGGFSSTAIVVGKLTDATVRCTGTVTSKATVVGRLSGTKRGLTGIAIAHSTVSGALISEYTGPGWPVIPPRLLTGTIVAQCTTSAALSTTGIEQLAGTLTANCVPSGSLKVAKKLSGTITAQSITSGHLGVIRRVAGTVVTQSTVNGSLSITGKVRLYGTIACQSTLAGFVKVDKRFVGVITSTSVISADLIIPSEFVGAVISSSIVSGRMRVTKKFTCTIVCISGTSGALVVKGEVVLIGIIVCKSIVSGNLGFYFPRFLVTQVTVLPIFAQSVAISPVLAGEVAALPVFTHAVEVLPVLGSLAIGTAVFTHSIRVNERLKVLV